METLLNQRGLADGKRVEVVNAGVPFMSARQSFDWYEHRGAGYEPDLAHAVACLNLTPDLVNAARSGARLYYWLDGHWTPEGNAVAATALARRLLEDAPSLRTR